MKKKIIVLMSLFAGLFALETFLTACESEKKFNIYFYVDGEIVDTVQTAGNEIIEMPSTPRKEGFTFNGWFEDENIWQIEFSSSSLATSALTEDKNVYAKWEVNNIQIKDFFTADDSNYSIKVPNSTATFDFTPYVYVSSGYTWFISLDAECAEKIENNVVSLNVGDNLFYGVFVDSVGEKVIYSFNVRRRPMHTVTFDSNGGSPVDSQQIEEDQMIVFVAPPTKNGYIFSGWKGGINEPISQDTRFVAQWILERYTIEYELNDGSQNSENPTEYSIESDDIILKNPTKEHYEFAGWFNEQDLTETTIIENGSFGNKKFFAKWTPKNYSITYDLANGSNDDRNPSGYNIESPKIELKNPFREHYNFVGWFDDKNHKTTQIEAGSFGDLVLHARWEAIHYNITYILDDGDCDNPQNYTVEDPDIVLNPATKQHYDFLGWFRNDDFENELENEVKIIHAANGENITLYAKFNPHEYQITYELDEGEQNAANPTTYNVEQSNIPLHMPTKNGYDFEGWFLESNFLTRVEELSTSTGKDICLFAKWKLKEYTITYNNLLDGENSNENPNKYTIISSKIELKPATRPNYDFIGWFDENGEPMEEIITGSTGNKTLSAKWTATVYEIHYILNNGQNNPDNPESYTVENDNIELKNPTRDYYNFSGWFLEEEFEHQIFEIETKIGGVVTVYAKWTPIEYHITYENVLEGENDAQNPTSYNIESNTIKLKDATREHYKFDGWYEEDNFETKVETIESSRCEELTLYAKFTPIKYTINYVLYDGQNNPDNPKDYTVENDNIKLLNPSKDFYTFSGWFLEEEFEHQIFEIETKIGGVVTVYAKWTPIEFHITYENVLEGENDPQNPTSYNIKSGAIKLKDATREHYNFEGWYEENNFETKVEQIQSSRCEDLTLYAKFTAIRYKIIYELDKGENNPKNPENYTVENEAITLQDPSRNYYSFAGWFKDENRQQQIFVIETKLGGKVTVYAKWTPIEYDITYKDVNDGENDLQNPATYNITSSEIDLKPATRQHYDFLGWFDEQNERVDKIQAGSHGNKTFTAKWTASKYTINYILEDGKNNPDNPKDYTIEDGDITLLDPSRQYYIFSGWFKDAARQQKISVIETKIGGEVTVYAKWTPKEFQITYNGLENASVEQGNPTSYNIETQETKLNPATRTGYIFAGWYKEGSDELIEDIHPGMHDDLILNAKWNSIFVFEDGVIGGLSDYAKSKNLSEVEIFAEIDKIASTGIGQNAFADDLIVETITIPASITKIGANAFAGCNNLKNLNFYGTLEQWLKIDFENEQSNPLSNPFAELKIDGQTINSLELNNSINSFAVNGWHNLHDVTIPENLNFSGFNFANTTIASVEFKGSILDWTQINFASHQNNPLCNGADFVCDDFQGGSLEIFESISIGNYAFFGCTNIEELFVYFNTEFQSFSVGDGAFANSSLNSISYTISIDYLDFGEECFNYDFACIGGIDAFENCNLSCNLIFNLSCYADLANSNLNILFPSSNPVTATMTFSGIDIYEIAAFLNKCVETGLNLDENSTIFVDSSPYTYAELRDEY